MRLKYKDKPEKPKPPAWMESLLAKQRQMIRPFAEVSLTDIRNAFENIGEDFSPVLSLKQAAKLAHIASSTLKHKVSEGHFKDSVKRGKPLLFWRDKFVKELLK